MILAEASIEHVLSIYRKRQEKKDKKFIHVKNHKFNIVEENKNSNMTNTGMRLRLFAANGTVCANCGALGDKFEIYANPNPWGNLTILKLSCINKRGQKSFLTIDHILPIAKGGSKGKLYNHQVMCEKCNNRKGDKVIDWWDIAHRLARS